MTTPVVLVVAGPSGSGKSALFPVGRSAYAAFNVDDRCRELHGSYLGIPPAVREQAQRECEAFIASHIAAHTSFAVETTLRTSVAIQQAQQAKAAGFEAHMVYVGTADIELNVARVAARVRDGGHGAPADRVREIYRASLANLPFAIAVFDWVQLFDNSVHDEPPTLISETRGGRLVDPGGPLPAWLEQALRRGPPEG